MRNSILPREGLTLEAVFAPIRLTVLQPVLTGSILLLLYRYPTFAAKWLSPSTSKLLQSPRVLTGLSVAFGVGLIRKINNALSRLVLNNFTTDKTWDWSKEIVVITGGSGGIGSLVVRMLAEKNIQVIILDIAPPKTPITGLNPARILKSPLC
jgi:all-trans-retinol dehydrogenase (NAD+)